MAAILPLWRRKKTPRPIGNSSAFLIHYWYPIGAARFASEGMP
jgi:hypothetical protein